MLKPGMIEGRYWSLGTEARGLVPLTIARRLSAKLTALRRFALSWNTGRAELKAIMRKVKPGLTKNRERLIPYFATSPRLGSK